MTRYEHADIYFFLAYASASKKEPAMTRHWLNKYSKLNNFDLELVDQHPAFEEYRQQDWFIQILHSRMH